MAKKGAIPVTWVTVFGSKLQHFPFPVKLTWRSYLDLLGKSLENELSAISRSPHKLTPALILLTLPRVEKMYVPPPLDAPPLHRQVWFLKCIEMMITLLGDWNTPIDRFLILDLNLIWPALGPWPSFPSDFNPFSCLAVVFNTSPPFGPLKLGVRPLHPLPEPIRP